MADQDLLREIALALVKNPDKVQVKRSVDEMGVLLRLYVAKEDMPLVIGSRGATANLLRAIMKLAGMNVGARISVKIEEPVMS